MNMLKVLFLATLAVAKQPNILFVLTDDQGKYVGGLEHMPKLQVRQFTSCPKYKFHFTANNIQGKPSTTRNKLFQALLLNRAMLSVASELMDRPHATQHQRDRRGPTLRRLSQSSFSRLERQLSPSLDARCWI